MHDTAFLRIQQGSVRVSKIQGQLRALVGVDIGDAVHEIRCGNGACRHAALIKQRLIPGINADILNSRHLGQGPGQRRPA